MRPLEWLLLIADALALCLSFIPYDDQRGRSLAAPGLVALLVLLHLLAEGYRWQMLPAYTLTAVLVVLGLWRARRPAHDKRRRGLAVTASLAGLLWLGVAVALPLLLPIFSFPDPTGPYQIGTVTYYWIDESREEIFTADPSDRRELIVQVWYPAEPPAGATPAPYLADADRVAPALARALGLPSFVLDHMRYVRTHAIPDAPMSGARPSFPVLIFSHGRGGFRAQNTFQVEQLVSHGYVVVGIDHPYASAAVVFPDGRSALIDLSAWPDFFSSNFVPVMEKYVEFLADDARFVLDELMKVNAGASGAPFAGRLDLSRVGIFGHSLGGAVAAEACRRDLRFSAGIDMDAGLFTDVVETGLEQPFMFLTREPTEFRQQCARLGNARCQAFVDQQFGTIQAVLDRSTAGALVTVAGTYHYNFSDLPLFTPLASALGLTGSIDRQRGLRLINDYTLAFFDKHLKGESVSLLDGPSPDYPEVHITTRSP